MPTSLQVRNLTARKGLLADIANSVQGVQVGGCYRDRRQLTLHMSALQTGVQSGVHARVHRLFVHGMAPTNEH